MSKSTSLFFAVIFVCLAFVLSRAQALPTIAPLPVPGVSAITDCGFAITKPGTYDLKNDLRCGLGITAISITNTSNVNLRLNGHKIQGVIPSNKFLGVIGISVTNAPTITIHGEGATLTGFTQGIVANNTPHLTIAGLNGQNFNIQATLTGISGNIGDNLAINYVDIGVSGPTFMPMGVQVKSLSTLTLSHDSIHGLPNGPAPVYGVYLARVNNIASTGLSIADANIGLRMDLTAAAQLDQMTITAADQGVSLNGTDGTLISNSTITAPFGIVPFYPSNTGLSLGVVTINASDAAHSLCQPSPDSKDLPQLNNVMPAGVSIQICTDANNP